MAQPPTTPPSTRQSTQQGQHSRSFQQRRLQHRYRKRLAYSKTSSHGSPKKDIQDYRWHHICSWTRFWRTPRSFPIPWHHCETLNCGPLRRDWTYEGRVQSRGIWSWLWNNTSSYHKIALIFQQYVLTIQFHNSFTSKLDHPPMSASWIKQRVSRCFEFDVVKLLSQIRTAVIIVG